MKTGNTYIRENWFQLAFTVVFTLLPIGLCLFFLLNYSSGVLPFDEWFKKFGIRNNQYHINNILLLFIIVSYFSLSANLFIYLIETESKAYNYRGSNTLFKKLNILSLIINLAVLIGIPVFILRTTNYDEIIHYNRYVSIIIFIAFTITDGLMWYQECLARKTLRDPIKIKLCRNNIAFSRKSIALINFPALMILGFSLVFHNSIDNNAFFKNYFDGHDTYKIENFKLFIDGFETSVIFTSIIITQIVFAVLKIKWSYRKYQIENYVFDPKPEPKSIYKSMHSKLKKQVGSL